MTSVSLLAGPVTRTWRCGPRHAPVQLYHNTLTGQRWLTADGIEVPGSVGTFYGPLSNKTYIMFTLDDNKGVVTLEAAGSRVIYQCVYNEVNIPEENSIIDNGNNINQNEVNNSSKLRITIDITELGTDEENKPVTWFKVRTVRESGKGQTVVHRRFNNFLALDEALRSAYKGSPILQSFPSMPTRGIKLLTDQFDPAYIEKRRWLLQDYLYKVENIPRMRTNLDFLTFLGLLDNTRETSCLFPPSLPLGLTLTAKGEFTEITGMKPMPDGRPGPVVADGIISIGDKVSKINGEDVLDNTYDIIIAKIKSAPRPLVIHFLGTITPKSNDNTNSSSSSSNSGETVPVQSFNAFAGTSTGETSTTTTIPIETVTNNNNNTNNMFGSSDMTDLI